MSGPGVAAGAANARSSSSGFAPLRHRVYAMLWAATVLGNTGTFMRDGTTSWLVRDLSRAPAVPPSCRPPARVPSSFSPYDKVGARALAIYLTVFNGAMAAGSIVRAVLPRAAPTPPAASAWAIVCLGRRRS